MKQNFKRTIAFLLIFSLIGGYFPSGVEAAVDYDAEYKQYLEFEVKTADVYQAGTDGSIYLKYEDRAGKKDESNSLDARGNDFERNDLNRYNIYDFGLKDSVFPWDMKNVGVRFEHEGWGPDWLVEHFKIRTTEPDATNEQILFEEKFKEDEWIKKDEEFMGKVDDVALATQVVIKYMEDIRNIDDNEMGFLRKSYISPYDDNKDEDVAKYSVLWNGWMSTNYGRLNAYDPDMGFLSSKDGLLVSVEGIDSGGGNNKYFSENAEDKYFEYFVNDETKLNYGYALIPENFPDLKDKMLEYGINKLEIKVNPNVGNMGKELYTYIVDEKEAPADLRKKSAVNLEYGDLPGLYKNGINEINLTHFALVHDPAFGVGAEILTKPTKSLYKSTYSGNSTPGSNNTYERYFSDGYITISVPIANPELDQKGAYNNWNNYLVDTIGYNFEGDAHIEVDGKEFKASSQRYNSASTAMEFTFRNLDDIKNIENNGFSLIIDNIESACYGNTYVHSVRDGNGYKQADRFEITFSDDRIDTEGPEMDITAISETDEPIKKFDFKVDFIDNETSYSRNVVNSAERYENRVVYSLYEQNDNNTNGKQIMLDGANEDFSKTVLFADNRAYSISPYKTAFIEGNYNFEASAYDRAGNESVATEELILDTRAPRVTLEKTEKINPTNTQKSMEFEFDIEDISPAKIYYYFRTEGMVPDPPTGDSYNNSLAIPPTGEINSKPQQWYVLDTEMDNVGTTVTLVAEQDEVFTGTLYYYAVDKLGNNTRFQDSSNPTKTEGFYTESYKLDFDVAEAEVITDTFSNYPTDYDIDFIIDEGGDLSYFWSGNYDHDDDDDTDPIKITTETVNYSVGDENVGSKNQFYREIEDKYTLGNIKELIMDGTWTLNYNVTSKSNNTLTYAKPFIFDNSDPYVDVEVEGEEITSTATLRINADDISSIVSMSYEVVDVDENRISGQAKEFIEDIGSNFFDTTISLEDLDTGAYKLKVEATDVNGFTGTTYSEIFKVRNGESEFTLKNEFEEYKDTMLTKEENLTLDFSIVEDAKDTESFVKDQYIQYRTSINGLYGEWITPTKEVAEGVYENIGPVYKDGKSVTNIGVEVVLFEGLNEIQTEYRFVVNDAEESATYFTEIYRIISDRKMPEHTIDIETPRDTKSVEAMSGRLVVSDDYTIYDDIRITEGKVDYEGNYPGYEGLEIIPVLDSEGKNTGEYDLVFTDSIINGVINVIDKAGNIRYISLTVDSVDTTDPILHATDDTGGAVEDEYDVLVNKGVGEVTVVVSEHIEDSMSIRLFNKNTGEELDDFAGLSMQLENSYFTEDSEGNPPAKINRFGEYMWEDHYKLSLTGLNGDYYVMITVEDAADNVNTLKLNFDNMTIENMAYDHVALPTGPVWGYAKVEVNGFNRPVFMVEVDKNIKIGEDGIEGDKNSFRNLEEYLGTLVDEKLKGTTDIYKINQIYKTNQVFLADKNGTYNFYLMDRYGNTTMSAIQVENVEYQAIAEIVDITTTPSGNASSTETDVTFDSYTGDPSDYSVKFLFTGDKVVGTTTSAITMLVAGDGLEYDEEAVGSSGEFTVDLSGNDSDLTEISRTGHFNAPESVNTVYYEVKVWNETLNDWVSGVGKYTMSFDGDMTAPKLELTQSHFDLQDSIDVTIIASDDYDSELYYDIGDPSSNLTDEEKDAWFNEEINKLTHTQKSGIKSVEIDYFYSSGHSDNRTVTYTVNDLTYDSADYDLDFETYDRGGGGLNLSIPIELNVELTITITNEAGLTTTKQLDIVNVIDPAVKAAAKIDPATDYEVKYYKVTDSDTKGDEIPNSDTQYYNRVWAEIVLTDSSNPKAIRATNSSTLSKILTPINDSFTFTLEETTFGQTHEQIVTFERFDIVAPEITNLEIADTDPTKDNVTVNFTATDDKSGIEKIELILNSAVTTLADDATSTTVDKNGFYKLRVTDKAGNNTEGMFVITNIDKTAPIMNVIYNVSSTAITSGDVLATYSFNEANVKILKITPTNAGDGLIDEKDFSVDYTNNKIRFENNGTIQVEFYDSVGNKNSKIIQSTQIWRKVPQIKLIEPELTANNLSALIKFDFDDTVVEINHPLKLKDYTAQYFGTTIKLADEDGNLNAFEVTENGTYHIVVGDPLGNYKVFDVEVTGIDRTPPKIIEMSYEYDTDLYGKTPDVESGDIAVDDSLGYNLGPDMKPETNQIVKITLKTDKESNFTGSPYDEYKTEHTVEYNESGTARFTMEARNELKDQYIVGVYVIDLVPPVIKSIANVKPEDVLELDAESLDKLEGLEDLVFYENMAAYENSDNKPYVPGMLEEGFIAYDLYAGLEKDLEVTITYEDNGTAEEPHKFDPINIFNNEFDRNKPYYVTYTTYDEAGNRTDVRREIILVGINDAIVRVNGEFPDSSGRIILDQDAEEIKITLENTGGKGYARYIKSSLTMGQMKFNGEVIASENEDYKTFVLRGLEKGEWYTVYLQTDMADYFVIKIARGDSKEEEEE